MAKVRKRTWATKSGPKTAWLVDYRDGDGKRRFATFERKKDADAKLVEVQGEVARGIHTPTSVSITLAEAADTWIERGKLEQLERSTLTGYRRNAERIKRSLGATKLAKLSTPAIESFRDELLRGSSRSKARKVLTSLKGIISEAQRRGLVAQNVALPVKVDIKARDKRRLEVGRDIPSKAEIQTILATATGRWRPLFVTAIFSGMRASELRGLRWVDVDFEKKVIRVRQRANLWGEIGSPKSRAGQREIPISPMVVNALREWRLACPKGDLDLVFPNGRGKIESHANIANRGFYALQRKANILDEDGKPKYGMHALRHFYASWLIDQGFAPKRVQTWLGHASITMTFDVYGHLFDTLEDDHAKLAAGELSIVGG